MESNECMDIIYSPSKWTKRGVSSEEVLNQHVKFVSQATSAARDHIPCQLNVSYGSTEREKYDIYGIDLPLDAPIFIFIHGGYWQELSKNRYGHVAASFYKKGTKVIVVGYTLCPNCTLENIVHETYDAISACLEYAKKCGSKGIYICGHSAGGHLTASLFQQFFCSISETSQQYIKGAICISGIYDLIPIVQTSINNAVKLTDEMAIKLSPLHQEFYAKENVTFLIIVAQYESPAFHNQAKLYYEKVKSKGHNVDLVEIKEVDHFSIIESLTDSNSDIFKLITQHIERAHEKE